MNLHKNIKLKLQTFIESNKIPNIIFHGPSGSGKRTLVNEFIDSIYNNKEHVKQYVMNVDCAQGKGIKFVREDLKFFAKSHINISKTKIFKTIIMLNADKLTIDAQSALRRCIEVYNHTTRFFIIIENKYKLLNPILSRFCEICIPAPVINNQKINLTKYNIESVISTKDLVLQREEWLKCELAKKCKTQASIIKKIDKIYEKAYSSLDVMSYIENSNIDDDYKWSLLVLFDKNKKEFRNEKLLMFFLLNFLYFRLESDLENILNM